MSLKINVIYKGIIYRVKGIKVLCSVVLAVIMLLVAIVAMGVWMLINVYEVGGGRGTLPSNSSQVNVLNETAENSKSAPSIEFGRSEDIVPSNILRHDLGNSHARKEIEPVRRNLQLPVASESEIYGAAFYDPERKDSYLDNGEFFSKKDKLDSSKVYPKFQDDSKANSTPKTAWRDNVEKVKVLPPDLLPKIINTAVLSNNTDYDQKEDYFEFPELDRTSFRQKEKEKYQFKTKQREEVLANARSPTGTPAPPPVQFYRRNGVPLKNKLTYIGPPVVGYGSNPYEIMTQERIKEYDIFWRTYAGSKINNKSGSLSFREVDKFAREDALRNKMRPHLRGLRPTGVEYDLPVRPDAQAPSKLKGPTLPLRPPTSPPPALPPQRRPTPFPSIRSQVPTNNPDRRLFVEEQRFPSPISTTTTFRPSIPLFSPLESLYDYSKKLAASLLSFNSKSADQIKNSSQKLAEYGINLIENHNQVFKHPVGGPFERIVELIPSAERLRSLDPFELSLITWTFLDFWEFLIEKVGTLSDKDLSLLQERLDKLRKRKDDTMTRVFVNETLNRYSSGKERSISDNIVQNNPMILTSNRQIAEENISQSSQSKRKNSTSSENRPSSQLRAGNGQILGNLFPSIANPEAQESHSTVEPSLSANNDTLLGNERNEVINSTVKKLFALLNSSSKEEQRKFNSLDEIKLKEGAAMINVGGRSSVWDPLGLFTSEARMEFMQFAVKVLFNFGKVYLKKPYALDCSMLLFCKDLNQDTKKGGLEAMAAKLKSVGLKVLTESEQELRDSDTFGQVWRSVTAWAPLQCDAMFPRCDGPKALEIVNEVAMGNH